MGRRSESDRTRCGGRRYVFQRCLLRMRHLSSVSYFRLVRSALTIHWLTILGSHLIKCLVKARDHLVHPETHLASKIGFTNLFVQIDIKDITTISTHNNNPPRICEHALGLGRNKKSWFSQTLSERLTFVSIIYTPKALVYSLRSGLLSFFTFLLIFKDGLYLLS